MRPYTRRTDLNPAASDGWANVKWLKSLGEAIVVGIITLVGWLFWPVVIFGGIALLGWFWNLHEAASYETRFPWCQTRLRLKPEADLTRQSP